MDRITLLTLAIWVGLLFGVGMPLLLISTRLRQILEIMQRTDRMTVEGAK